MNLNIQSLFVFSLFSLSLEAGAAQLNPSSMNVKPGSFDGRVASLAQANEAKAVNLYTNSRGNLSATFQIPASSASSLSLSARFKQRRSSDTFKFQVKDSSGSFVDVGSTSGSTSFKSLSFGLPNSSVVNGSISVRLVSSPGADDATLDSLFVVTDAAAPVPSTPVPSAPVPQPQPGSGQISGIPAGTTWYWQLQGTVKTNVNAQVYDIDLYDNSASLFASLKQAGRKVVCYFSAGTYENWRTDAKQFPAEALGSNVDGWPGEKWLDVRHPGVRAIMAQRMDMAKSKGCDSLEPDNVDGYSNRSGFSLTMKDQIEFNTFLADQAHARGMTIALKNSTDLVDALVDKFDYAVVEECFKYRECEAYSPFIKQNKAVLNAEYSSYSSSICSQAAALKFSTVFFNLDLNGAVYKPCQ